MKCVTGCTTYHGGEIRHHADCPFYPESLSQMYDMQKASHEETLTVLRKLCHELRQPIYGRDDFECYCQSHLEAEAYLVKLETPSSGEGETK